jgi:hypothetical protein
VWASWQGGGESGRMGPTISGSGGGEGVRPAKSRAGLCSWLA